jgi:hypothetical protein
MNTKNVIGMLVACTIFAGGMIVSSYVLSRFFLKVQHENQLESKLSVKGYAEKQIKSDIGVFTVTANVQCQDLASGYNKLKIDTGKVRDKIKECGFADSEINLNNIRVNKIFVKVNGKETNELQHYILSQLLTVRSANIELVSSKHKELFSLLAQGIEVMVEPPLFFIGNLEKYKQELISGATINATERASIMTRNCGAKIVRLLSARQGVIQITAPDSANNSDYGIFDTESPQKVIKVVVSLDFLIK